MQGDHDRLVAALGELKRPFDRQQISKLPATGKRPELDYVNHAHVTARLNRSAPGWSYTIDEAFTHDGDFWVRGTMTIEGVSRVEYGQGKNPLEAVSHFVRRAGMRFGVALDLWAKEELENVGSGGGDNPTTTATTVPPDPAPSASGDAKSGGTTAPLDAIIAKHGSSAKALLAARGMFGDVTSLNQLDPAQVTLMLAEKEG